MLQYHEIEQLAFERHRTLRLEASYECLRRSLARGSQKGARWLAFRRWIGGQLVRWGTHLQGEDQPATPRTVVGQPATLLSIY